mgnify:CR=1 FL=1
MQKSIKSKKANGDSIKLPQDKLDRAMLDAYDLMQRCLLDTTFIALGDTALCLKEGRALDCSQLEFGIVKKEITPVVLSTLKDWVKGVFDNNGFSYTFEGVPVSFTYITRNYHFFKYPDVKLYMPEFYRIANPFNNYWKARYLVR